MNVGWVRGVHLNPFELQLYQPLSETVRFILVGARWQFYTDPILALRMKTQYASVLGESLPSTFHSLPFLINRVSSRLLGRSFYLRHLARLLPPCDIYHSAETYHSMTYQCLQLKRQRGGKLVVTVSENIAGRGENHPIRRARKKAVLQEADAFIAISERTREMLQQEGVPAERIELIPMSIDLKRFQTSIRRADISNLLQLRPGSRRVLFLGRLSPEKGIQDLLNSIPQVRQQMPDVQFVFVGTGPLDSLVRKAANADPAIRMHPTMPYEAVPFLLREADVLVLPSVPIPGRLEEQFGFVLAEAMATGVPIVTTRVGAIPEVVGQAALLIDPHAPEQLAEALIQAIKNTRLRETLIQAGFKQVKARYDAVANSAKILHLYRRLVECPT